jgi:molybdenum cofactor cytidylyltransferase
LKFGDVSVAEAEGAILAHSVKLPDGALKKGRVLSNEDMARLGAAGFQRVTVARLEADDVGEDTAAAFVAARLCGDGVRAGSAFTGRVNLFAERDGLLIIDAGTVDALNGIHESVTLATLPRFTRVSPRQMLATVKIIPFAVPQRVLDAVDGVLEKRAPAIRVAPFMPKSAGLVQTRRPGLREAVLDKTARVMGERIAGVGGRLMGERRCSHDAASVCDAITAWIEKGADLVLVAGASAIVDRRDVVPAGIVAAGGEILHFGMPMDPGNLILVARRGQVPVVGLPGCARSPRFNGIDEVLRRVAADIDIGPQVIMGLGVGGLLKDTPDRPLPRSGRPDPPVSSTVAPRIFAVILAAGQSRRMGVRNKLLLEVGGTPLVQKVVDAALASTCDGVIVVTGHQADAVARAVACPSVQIVRGDRYAEGLSASLAAGVAALPDDCDAALICLGDMPNVSAAHMDAIIAAFDPVEGRAICVPTFQGKRGNPVLWGRQFFGELVNIRGDTGARHLIGEYADAVCEVPVADAGVLTDIDSPDALRRLLDGAIDDTAPNGEN